MSAAASAVAQPQENKEADTAAPVTAAAPHPQPTSSSSSAAAAPPSTAPPPAVLSLLSSLSRYLEAEVSSSASDYAMLASCVDAASARYGRMSEQSLRVLQAVSTLQAIYSSLSPFLSSVDELDTELQSLEAAVAALDAESRGIAAALRLMYQ